MRKTWTAYSYVSFIGFSKELTFQRLGYFLEEVEEKG